jgi:hypothetical protein
MIDKPTLTVPNAVPAEATFDGLIATFWKAPHHMNTQDIARLLNVRECRVANRLGAMREAGQL